MGRSGCSRLLRIRKQNRSKHVSCSSGSGSSFSSAEVLPYCYCPELVDSILDQCGRDFIPKNSGFIKHKDGAFDPFSVHFFHPPAFLGFWAALRESLVVDGLLRRKNKEVLGVFISNHNKCRFCTRAHLLAAQSLGADVDEVERALANACPLSLPHKKLGRVIEWVLAAQTRGAPSFSGSPPIPCVCIPEVLGVAFMFNYLNRVVDTFITRSTMLPSMPAFMKYFMKKSAKITKMVEKRIVEKVFGAIRKTCSPGESIHLMKQQPPLPKDFQWAKANKAVATGFGYWAEAMEDMATIYIPAHVKEFVTKFISQNYTGVPDHLTKQWAFNVANGLQISEAEKFATAFMILVSFAPFEIDDEVQEGLKRHFPNDRMRRAFGMWSAFQTAATIARWQYRAIHLGYQ